MIKYFVITKREIVVFLLSFALMFLATSLSYAENVSTDSGSLAAKKYGVSFPVAELGNCANLAECKTYCSDPLYQSECVDFAKKKGFFKEQKNAVKNAIAIAAKQELGCDSETSCKSFCGEEANWQKCGDFAKKHNLVGGQVADPSKNDILSKAKEVLGCGNYDSCKGFCAIDANKQKCDEFAKLVGLKGGVEKKGPGGCTSEETCKTFCSDPANYKICAGYISSIGGKFIGPGGCNSEQSCKSFCQEHQDICGHHAGDASSSAIPRPTLQEICTRTPNCSWKENSCLCGSPTTNNYEMYCKQYPDRCVKPSPMPYPSSTTSGDYAKKCADYGCSWTGSSCNCANKSPNPQPNASSSTTCQPPSTGCGTYHYFDKTSCTCKSYEDYCKSKGGIWTNNSCQLPTSSSPVPAAGTTGSALTACSTAVIKCPDGSYIKQFGPNCESARTCLNGTRVPGTSCESTTCPTVSGNIGTSSSVKGVTTVK